MELGVSQQFPNKAAPFLSMAFGTRKAVIDFVGCLLLSVLPSALCDSLRCPTYAMRECAGRGFCEDDGTCSCSAGFAGPDCAVSLRCDPEASRLPCNGRGACQQHGCDCATGYSGKLCEVDDWCPRDKLGRKCSGRGVCAAHSCLCPSYRSGVACEVGNPSARNVPVESIAR